MERGLVNSMSPLTLPSANITNELTYRVADKEAFVETSLANKETEKQYVLDFIYCEQCGEKLITDETFCMYCGNKLN